MKDAYQIRDEGLKMSKSAVTLLTEESEGQGALGKGRRSFKQTFKNRNRKAKIITMTILSEHGGQAHNLSSRQAQAEG